VNAELSAQRRILWWWLTLRECCLDALVVIRIDPSQVERSAGVLGSRKVDPKEDKVSGPWLNSVDSEGA
jgi:hypothetical protein